MTNRPRQNHSPAFKAKVAEAANKGEKTLIELAQNCDVHPNQIKQWRDQLLEGATGVFGEAAKATPEPVIDVKTLHAKIGELTATDTRSYCACTRRLHLGHRSQDAATSLIWQIRLPVQYTGDGSGQ